VKHNILSVFISK